MRAATLQGILKQYHSRIAALEDAKYDLEYEVRQKDFLVGLRTIGIRLCGLAANKQRRNNTTTTPRHRKVRLTAFYTEQNCTNGGDENVRRRQSANS